MLRLSARRFPPIDLAGAVVVVTGAARGIGLETARLFADRGSRVFLGDLDDDAARQQAAQIGPAALGGPLDVTDPGSFQIFLDQVTATAGPIDVLVNNAGVMPLGRFLDEPDQLSRLTMDVNVWGPIYGMRLALPAMIRRGRGHVVNIASMAGKVPMPGMGVYCASKFAVVGLSSVVRDELDGTGVSVSTVLPSAVRTELTAGLPLGHGLPAVNPDRVASAVVGSVTTRRARIPVPGWMAGGDFIDALTPEPVMRLWRRAMGAGRALDALDDAARASYEKRVADQVAIRLPN